MDEGGVALAGSQVKEGHSSEGLGVDQVFGLGPAGSAHHLLTHHHHAAFEGAAGRQLARHALTYTKERLLFQLLLQLVRSSVCLLSPVGTGLGSPRDVGLVTVTIGTVSVPSRCSIIDH